MADLLLRAREIADEVLFPAALDVDQRGEVPASHFDLLAEEGFYGLAVPAEHGGAGAGLEVAGGVMEAMAGGCLATSFTWAQHHGLVFGLAATGRPALRDRYLAKAVRGEIRGGVAFAGAIPQPPKLWAKRVSDGYLLDGEAPFVSGWGIIDLLQISARDADSVRTGPDGRVDGGTIVSGLIPAEPADGLSVEPLSLVAAQGTNTVRLQLTGYLLPAEQVVSESTHADFVAGQTFGSRMNGCFPLGLTGRCARLIEQAGRPQVAEELRLQQDQVRSQLDAGLADPSTMPAARAAASALAFRASGALVAAAGSGAVVGAHHAHRLVREATFTLVASSRPEIKAGLLDLLGKPV
ncbi:acyl-CoA dehydrogenase family protein [Amycolatopsis nigrescens]|uniref:acyl-CoA dehydrogenase family protein n=1 Tax=Amycolatopsis nigrescens TaxID=381445 RepID=UPI000380269F|nr:acyl-CoA dehydrogenase family protein [Amycolatopsis nigrescens]